MNFLSHCWLGRSEPALIAGGFLGDFIKGRLSEDLPSGLLRGLRLHRRIDAISNEMPEMRSGYKRFGPELRRTAPVMLDLVADHMLAAHWKHHGEGDLEAFTKNCYSVIGSYDIPPAARNFYRHMVDTDLLFRYARLDVMEEVMQRILRRLKFGHLSHELHVVLKDEYQGLYLDFCTYLPLLSNAVDEYLAEEAS